MSKIAGASEKGTLNAQVACVGGCIDSLLQGGVKEAWGYLRFYHAAVSRFLRDQTRHCRFVRGDTAHRHRPGDYVRRWKMSIPVLRLL